MREFGLIGYPLGHSFSKEYFSNKFTSEGIDASYSNFPISDLSQLPLLLKENTSLEGLNVTIPYKQDVIPYLDHIDQLAETIGAVNVISVARDGNVEVLYGYNTDIYGFTESLKPLLIKGDTNALVLGSGGASSAVVGGLRQLGIEAGLVSRSLDRGDIVYGEIDRSILRKCSLVINTTPAGMYPGIDGLPLFPYDFLEKGHLLYDLVYNPTTTRFMEEGLRRGCRVKGGLEMLHLQAEKAWEIWNRPNR